MIDQSTNLKEELLSLAESASCYYIKSSSIVAKISFKGRDFYTKYRLIQNPLDESTKERYLKGEIKIAIPLKRGEIFIRYFGDEKERFLYLLSKSWREFDKKWSIYFLDERENINIITAFESENIGEIIETISKRLSTILDKEWKILPDENLPDSYNIFTLPDASLFDRD